jgi:hypothetical protein
VVPAPGYPDTESVLVGYIVLDEVVGAREDSDTIPFSGTAVVTTNVVFDYVIVGGVGDRNPSPDVAPCIV